MDEQEPEIAEHVAVSRRSAIVKFVTTAAFVVPVVASFDMSSLGMGVASASVPCGAGVQSPAAPNGTSPTFS